MDDKISVWNYGEEELKGFLAHLNFWGGDLNFLNSGKDRTSVEQQSGVYKIPCTCESSCTGRTNQNLKMRLLQYYNSISSSLKQNTKPEDFTSALSEDFYNYPYHFILFENFSLISRDIVSRIYN